MGAFLTLVVLVAAIYFLVRVNVAFGFHYRGKGEMRGRAAYARIRRESPDSADAKLSEAEFVENFIKAGPKVWLNLILALTCGVLFVVVGLGAVLGSAAGH
jgi:hypothetical protein